MSDVLRIARVNRADNVVVNLELAEQEWVDAANEDDTPYYFVVYSDDNLAYVGLPYDPATGVFEWPEFEVYPGEAASEEPWTNQ
jgi:hypothetical protein